MTIYQYTNIEALAYILKYRTIRFHRLDKVDDVEEGNAESLGVKFCKYILYLVGQRWKKKTYLFGKCMEAIKKE